MEQITQLKQIRDEALARLQNNPDYKLLISLDRLIREMEGLVSGSSKTSSTSPARPASAAVVASKSADTASKTEKKADEPSKEAIDDIDKAFDKIASDLQNELESSATDVNADIKTAMSGNGSKATASASASK